MAIERATEPLPPESTNETVDLPASILAGQTVAPGDVVRLEVVSVDDETGMVTAKYATATPTAKGSDSMAEEFDEPQPD